MQAAEPDPKLASRGKLANKDGLRAHTEEKKDVEIASDPSRVPSFFQQDGFTTRVQFIFLIGFAASLWQHGQQGQFGEKPLLGSWHSWLPNMPSYDMPDSWRLPNMPSYDIPDSWRLPSMPSYDMPEGWRLPNMPSYDMPEGWRLPNMPSYDMPEGWRLPNMPSYDDMPDGWRMPNMPSYDLSGSWLPNMKTFERSDFTYTMPPWADQLSMPSFPYSPTSTNAVPPSASYVVFILLIGWSIWESLKHPRHCSHGSFANAVKSLLQLVGDVVLVPIMHFASGEKPLLGFQLTQINLDILAMCPTLQHFKQASYLRNAYVAFITLVVRDLFGKKLSDCVRRELVHCADGGTVALDWWDEDTSATFDKVIFISTTLTGDALNTVTREACRHFSGNGWKAVVMVKRGCGIFMNNEVQLAEDGSAPPPWCFNGFEDVKLAIQSVQRACPGLPICVLGFSTGAGQLRNYINSTGASSGLSGAVLVDGASNWTDSIASCDERLPLIAFCLSGAAQQSYKTWIEAQASSDKAAAVETSPFSFIDFVKKHMAPAFGFEASEEGVSQYLNSCTPADPAGCRIPTLELFTYNDTLIPPSMVADLQQLYAASPHIITGVTLGGTHMVRWETWSQPCWLCKASQEFLSASLAVCGESTNENVS